MTGLILQHHHEKEAEFLLLLRKTTGFCFPVLWRAEEVPVPHSLAILLSVHERIVSYY